MIQKVRVGDRIRIVRIPEVFSKPGYVVHRDTKWVFRKLIDRGRALRVSEVDEQGFPWVNCRFRMSNGRWRYDSLAVDHDAWVKVKKRRK